MALRYTSEDLILLRESPLCVKPNALPPAEEWMGPPPDTFRNNQSTGKTGTDRARNGESSLADQSNRRPGADRHASRNNTNNEGIVLGPPRTTFQSSTVNRGTKPFDNDKTFGSYRRNGEGESDRVNDRERGDRGGDGRTGFRRRGDGDQDSDGWTAVKPRKSFGTEGAERFNGRMGVDRNDRFSGDRRLRDGQEENSERSKRNNFGEYGRDKEEDDNDRPRRSGLARARTDQSTWNRGNNDDNEQPPPARERFDRAKSWRERAAPPEDQPRDDRRRDRNERGGRWDRDQRQEREPEWFDEPVEEKPQAHSIQDLQKFMEAMKKGGPPTEQGPMGGINTAIHDSAFEAEAAKVKSAPAVEMGPDQFFAKYASTPGADMESPLEVPKETPAPKPKGGSRFGSFFASQQGRQTEPSTPAAAAPPIQEQNPLLFFAGAGAPANTAPNAPPGNLGGTDDRAAFENILLKLKKQHLTSNSPPSGGFPAPSIQERNLQGSIASPGPNLPFGHEREEPPSRGPPIPQENYGHRQQPSNYLPQGPGPMGAEAQLHHLIAQRQPPANQTPGRDQTQARNNAEFLISLMQSSRNPSEPTRNEQIPLRMPQPSRPAQIPQTPDREPDFVRERNGPHQQGRPHGLPGFFDEPQIRHEQDTRRQQPTQILQRPGPVGPDQLQPNWLQGGAGHQVPPGAGRPMIPPPGLAGNPRNIPNGPMPGIFPPGFPPMGAFPPDGMRNMAPPPGLYGGPGGPGGPPHGFIPPPGMGNFPVGPEALVFGFDARGMPPPGAANFRRN